jgi:hypothetical protein
MRIKDKYRIIIYSIIISQVLPWILNFIAVVIGLFIDEAFWTKEPFLSEITIYIANWPSFLMKIYPTITTTDGSIVIDFGKGIFDHSVILYNSIGWAIVGLIVGIIISVTKFKKQVEE